MADNRILVVCLTLFVCSAAETIDIDSRWNELLRNLTQGGASLEINNFVDDLISLVHQPKVFQKLEPFNFTDVPDCDKCSVHGISTMYRSAPAKLTLISPKTAQLRTTVIFRNLTANCFCRKSIRMSRSTVKNTFQATNVSVIGIFSQETSPNALFSVDDLKVVIPQDTALSSNGLLEQIQILLQFFIRGEFHGKNIHDVSKFLTT